MKRLLICALSLCAIQLARAGGPGLPIADLKTLAETVACPDSEGLAFVIDRAVIASPPSKLGDTFTVCDGTGYLRVTDAVFWPERPLLPGDRLKLSGVIVKQDTGLYNYAIATNIHVLAHGTALPPTEASASEINAGKVLDRLVRTEGRVVDVFRDEIDPRFIYFVLADGHDFVYASLYAEGSSDDGPPFSLLDAVIRITGLCSRQQPRLNCRLIDISLSIRAPEAITVVIPPPGDPFSAPMLNGRVHEVQKIPGSGTFRRKVIGTVVAVWGRNTALVRTENYAFSKIGFSAGPLPACGDFIEAVGAPETDLYTLNLSRALWRRANGTAVPPAQAESVPISRLFTDVRGNAAIDLSYQGQVLRFAGKVRALPTLGNERLTLECGGHSLPVEFSAVPNALNGIEIGCTLEATGICVMETENWRPQLPFPQIKGFFLVVRTADDIRILSRPPWWTPGKLLAVIILLCVALLAVLLRNILQSRLSRVRLDERTRLAVELHDTIAQNLTGASFEINAAERLVPTDGAASLGHLDRAARTLKSCRDELRNCIWDLRNRALEAPDMNAAIRCTLEQHVGDTSLAVRFNVSRSRFSDDSAHALLRIIRELTLNAVRHGNARHVKIAGSVENGVLLFSVRDDGSGFDPANCPGLREGHFGLQGIRERIKKFNGDMVIESRAGTGTRVVLSMALPSGENGTLEK